MTYFSFNVASLGRQPRSTADYSRLSGGIPLTRATPVLDNHGVAFPGLCQIYQAYRGGLSTYPNHRSMNPEKISSFGRVAAPVESRQPGTTRINLISAACTRDSYFFTSWPWKCCTARYGTLSQPASPRTTPAVALLSHPGRAAMCSPRPLSLVNFAQSNF